MAHGPVVRVRRLSAAGVTPVVAALEVDRRAGTRRDSTGFPPPLVTVEAASEAEALARLQGDAASDANVARLLQEKGLR